MRPDTRESIVGWLGLLCMAVLLFIFGLWCARPAAAQEFPCNGVCDRASDIVKCPDDCPTKASRAEAQVVCVTQDPRPGLWQPCPMQVQNRPEGIEEAKYVGFPPPLDVGALRQGAGGCWEILVGTTYPAFPRELVWEPYDPARRSHVEAANAYQAVGVGYQEGHTGDDAMSHRAHYAEVYGTTLEPGSYLDFCYQHSSQERQALQLLWCAMQPPAWPGCPVCGDGKCDIGERVTCKADCRPKPPTEPPADPPKPPEEPPTCPHCPACEVAELKTALDRCEAEMASCGKERGILSGRVVELEVHLDGALRSLGACETIIDALTAERDGLKAMHAEALPADLEVFLRSQKPPLLSGLGRRAKYRRLAGPVCQRWSCPEELKP